MPRYPKCPMCRSSIYTIVREIPLARSSDKKADIVGQLCCIIRLYIISNPTRPETHKALSEWVHGPTFGGRTVEEGQPLAGMRDAVEIWDEFGDIAMWKWMRARKWGDFPNDELGSDRVGRGGEGRIDSLVELQLTPDPVTRQYDDH